MENAYEGFISGASCKLYNRRELSGLMATANGIAK
jgi:hypothetical protein